MKKNCQWLCLWGLFFFWGNFPLLAEEEMATLSNTLSPNALQPNTSQPNAPQPNETSPKNFPAGERLVVNLSGVDFAFRWCPPGDFWMGSTEEEFNQTDIYYKAYDELLHPVTFSRGFWILETEVTQQMYLAIAQSNPSFFAPSGKGKEFLHDEVTDNFPVESVSWQEACDFVDQWNAALDQGDFSLRLETAQNLGNVTKDSDATIQQECDLKTFLTDWRLDLPTEAQWEYACRAGTQTEFSGTGNLDEMGWFVENSQERTHAVASKHPNHWGIYDMHGNVWEWCRDGYDEEFYANSPQLDPYNPPESQNPEQMDRGGAWNGKVRHCRAAYRGAVDPAVQWNNLGIRPLLRLNR